MNPVESLEHKRKKILQLNADLSDIYMQIGQMMMTLDTLYDDISIELEDRKRLFDAKEQTETKTETETETTPVQ